MDSCVFTTGDKSISIWAHCPNARQQLMLVSEEIRGFPLLRLVCFLPNCHRMPREGHAERGRGRCGEEQAQGKAQCFRNGARSAPLCLLCTYGVGRGPRRGSKYCERRWGFPWRSAIARFPPAGSQPAQPFWDSEKNPGAEHAPVPHSIISHREV